MTPKKQIFLFIVIIVGSSLIGSCNKNGSDLITSGNELVGTWVLTKIIVAYPPPQGKTELTPQQANMTMTIIIKNDKTLQLIQNTQGRIINESGTWSVDNGILTAVSISGKITLPYRINGNILQLDTTEIDAQTGNTLPITLEFTKQ